LERIESLEVVKSNKPEKYKILALKQKKQIDDYILRPFNFEIVIN